MPRIERRLVSVVIPCLNEAPFLRTLLDSLRAQDAPIHEVIVVDNGSTDGSGDLVMAYQRQHPGWPLRLMTCSTQGAAAAMNVGVAGASIDIIIRLDGHCVPRPDYVRRRSTTCSREGGCLLAASGKSCRAAIRVGRAIASAFSHKLATGAHTVTPIRSEPTPVDTVPFGATANRCGRSWAADEFRNEDYVQLQSPHAGWSVLLNPTIRSTYFARETSRGSRRNTFSMAGARPTC
jgi:glycosyltransferase involved in cell wall biosynthesis